VIKLISQALQNTYFQYFDEIPETRVLLQQSVQIIGHLSVLMFDLRRRHIYAKHVVFINSFHLILFIKYNILI